MQQPVGKLRPKARLEVRQQVELAAVVGAVAWPAERHHAVGVVAAERARHQVGRGNSSRAAGHAGLADDFRPAPWHPWTSALSSRH
jgi:hypothetical protein